MIRNEAAKECLIEAEGFFFFFGGTRAPRRGLMLSFSLDVAVNIIPFVTVLHGFRAPLKNHILLIIFSAPVSWNHCPYIVLTPVLIYSGSWGGCGFFLTLSIKSWHTGSESPICRRIVISVSHLGRMGPISIRPMKLSLGEGVFMCEPFICCMTAPLCGGRCFHIGK